MWEINVWQLEWDGERSTACDMVNLSGKAKPLGQTCAAATAEHLQ